MYSQAQVVKTTACRSFVFLKLDGECRGNHFAQGLAASERTMQQTDKRFTEMWSAIMVNCPLLGSVHLFKSDPLVSVASLRK